MVKLGHARIICLQGRLHRDKKRHDVGATRDKTPPHSARSASVRSPTSATSPTLACFFLVASCCNVAIPTPNPARCASRTAHGSAYCLLPTFGLRLRRAVLPADTVSQAPRLSKRNVRGRRELELENPWRENEAQEEPRTAGFAVHGSCSPIGSRTATGAGGVSRNGKCRTGKAMPKKNRGPQRRRSALLASRSATSMPSWSRL